MTKAFIKPLLAKNSKIEALTNDEIEIYNFGIPAYRSRSGLIKTCPNAGICAAGCYARSGFYNMANVNAAYEFRLEATQRIDFVHVMRKEILTRQFLTDRKGKALFIRIHDSGDFYSEKYLQKWINIIDGCPDTRFYAYTKMVKMLKASRIPQNFEVIYSLGGKQDYLINPDKDRHSRVFESKTKLLKAGYQDATDDDLVAVLGKNKIGLVYHGQKSFNNSLWGQV